MQFTTISGRKMPRASYSEGTKACISSWMIVTKVLMTTMYAGMRTLLGIKLRKAEMTRLDPSSTRVAARPIPMPFVTLVVTAMIGQVPSTRRKTGFSLNIPLTNTPLS
ncbi:hypothetical protein SDC9_108667 [bioreactor metagenome]|uniref:Uncharacterized protein n=1 Tax=bioreactor metagenome TaxID=1076179 RepID=A0A645BJ88_9ZZZZ